jgi:PAS domain S-box-containing protein
VLNFNGDLEYVVLQHYDISERKQAEEELRRRENQYNAIVENSGDYIMRYDRDHRHIWGNQNAIKATGLTPEQYLGKTHREMSFPEHLCKLWGENIGEVFTTGEVRRIEFDVELENGLMTLDLQFNPEFDEKGNVLSVIGVSRDITDRKTEEKRYKKTIESSFDGFWIVDRKGNFLEVNEAYSRMIGYSRNELLKMSILSIEAIEHHEEIKKRIEKIIETGRDRFESKHRHKSGHTIDVEINAAYTHDNDGLFFVFLRDITERNQMEEHLRQAQKMESIGTLAGGIAHDFNNILFPIVGYAEMLLEDVPEDSPLKDNLKEIYTSALRAKSLVKQILTFSRQENNELMLMKMQPIVKEALKLIRSTIPTTIGIKQDISTDCGVIKADPTQIHQIVMNLATNAYHAMEETGGELKVSLKEVELGEYDIITPDMTPGVYACLTVADTGVGMDKNLTDKIFDPFFTTKAVGKGTGMGLSVVHGIVISMNGAIQAYSEPGKGTEFHVYLPVEKSLSEKQATNSQAQATVIRGGTEHILFVDDEEQILAMGKQMLERLGYQVASRTSSLEALEAFRKNPDKFDMVITDMAMPNMSGEKLSVELTSA